LIDVMQDCGKPLSSIPPCCLTYPLKRARHALPALGPQHVTLKPIPLGQPPFLRRLLGLRLGLVRRLRRYYWAVRLPVPVHHRRASLDFPIRPPSGGRHRISRFPLKVLTYMHRVLDRAKSKGVSRYRRPRFSLPTISTASAPRSSHRFRDGVSISRLNTCLHAPLSTLHLRPYGRQCMTRSRCGSLALHRMKLSFTTPCRFLPAHRNPKHTQKKINLKVGKSKTPNPKEACLELYLFWSFEIVSNFGFRASNFLFSASLRESPLFRFASRYSTEFQ